MSVDDGPVRERTAGHDTRSRCTADTVTTAPWRAGAVRCRGPPGSTPPNTDTNPGIRSFSLLTTEVFRDHRAPPERAEATRPSQASSASIRSLTVTAPWYCSPLTNSVGVPRTPLRTPELKSASTRSSTNWVAGHTTLSGGTPISSA